MAFNTVRGTPDSRDFDAYYSDEFGVLNTAANIRDPANKARVGIHKNKFTVVSASPTGVTEAGKSTATLLLENAANPYTNQGLVAAYRQTQIPKDFDDRNQVGMYFSDSTIAAVASGESINIRVTILYAVGTEMNRHGIRSYFEKVTACQALILVPGTEPPVDPDRWGIAVSDSQIKQLIKQQFGKDIPYTVAIMAGFSTGACGLHQTFLHNLIKLDSVERVIYFDCLYENQCRATPASQAITNLKLKAPKAKILVYKTSEAGNDYVKNSNFSLLAVPFANARLFDSRGIVGNLFQKADYISVICFRSLESAATDRIITIPSSLASAFNGMNSILSSVPRGSFISNKVAYDYVYGVGTKTPPGGKTFFEDWVKSNSAPLAAFSAKLGDLSKVDTVRYLLWNNELPGWSGGLGEEKHDLLVPEFGWEFLV